LFFAGGVAKVSRLKKPLVIHFRSP